MPQARDVVLVTTHDIGRHLGCYGAAGAAGPNLDALAAGGVRFTKAFATAPQCSPSRASLATGLHPHQNGVMGLAHRGFDWDLRVPHLAARLAALGFQTHLFGGQHVTPRPERLGFAEMHGPGDDAAKAAQAAEVLQGAAADRRLYLEVNFDATHRPYPPAPPEPAVDLPPFLPDIPEAHTELGALQVAIGELDAAVGVVLEALERAGRARDAFVVFTTDHGLAMPGAKCTLYDAGLEVALLARWPAGGFGGGAVSELLVSNIDVAPALLHAAGAGGAPGLQGRDAIFAEKTFHSYYDPMRCIRTRRHKLIRNFENAFAIEVPADVQAGPTFRADPTRYSRDRESAVEVYDLEADPLERKNLAGGELEHELSAALWAWMRATGDPLLAGPVASPWYPLAMQ